MALVPFDDRDGRIRLDGAVVPRFADALVRRKPGQVAAALAA